MKSQRKRKNDPAKQPRHRLVPALVVFLFASVFPGELVSAEAENDLLIIVNRTVDPDGLSLDLIRDYFLKRRSRWPNGSKVIPVNAKAGAEARRAFQARVLEMHPDEEKLFWSDQKIRKGLTPPPEIQQNQRAVFKLKGSVSYVLRRDFKKGVATIVLVVPPR